MRSTFASLVLAAVVACDQPPTGPGRSPASEQLATTSFVFHYDSSAGAPLAGIADYAEARAAGVLEDLGVDQMPRVNVRYYRDRAALAAAVAPLVGAIPSFATGLVTSSTEIHAVVPSASNTIHQAGTLVVHEFAHCVTLRINGQSANNPRWLWESVALFEAREFVHPGTLTYFNAGAPPPSLAQLSSFDDTRIYQVGYLLAEFVVQRGGLSALRQLIGTRGDIDAVLGLNTASFEREWVEFVRDRYLR